MGLENSKTPRFRQIEALAQLMARNHGREEVSEEHIFRALFQLGQGVAWKVLKRIGYAERLSSHADGLMGCSGKPSHDRDIPYSPAAQKIITTAFAEAEKLGWKYVGTEHILFALIQSELIGAYFRGAFPLSLETAYRLVAEELSCK